LGQRQLPLTENRVGTREQFLRFAPLGVRNVALAAEGEQQRVDAGGIDCVDGVDARHHRRNDRAGEFVDDLAEAGVLLRRTADDVGGGPRTKRCRRKGTPRRMAAAWWRPRPRWIW